jgi:hypothetical protein
MNEIHSREMKEIKKVKRNDTDREGKKKKK